MNTQGEYADKIGVLKKQRNAVILAHNYQLPEVQDIADYRGDSLELSRIAASVDAKVIVFCGVYFMAETASILSPDKTILIPDKDAGCPLANMINAEQLKALKKQHPGAVVVGYVNSSAEVKALLDVCCTSSNAVTVVNSLKEAKEIIFVPDKYLGDYVAKKTGRKLITWDGFCPTHVKILPEDIARARKQHPRAEVIVHPECLPEVVAAADAALSTGKMSAYARASKAKEFIVGTETGIIYRLKQECPGKEFYPASERAVCPNMKRTIQEKVLRCLETMREEVRVSETVRRQARAAIQRMLEIK